jgi:transportin-1
MHYRYRKTDGDDDVESFMWTTRKQAALVIDTMADRLPPRLLLDLILPKIELCLNSGSVWTIEAGMLALGAISNGCFEEMRSHISSLLPLLTGSLSEASQSYPPELIAISCWVLKRYATFWFCSKDDMEEYNISMDMIANEQYLILTSLLKAMLNRNVQVQCAVCATLGTIFENIEITESHNHTDIIHANLEQILSYIHQGFQIYGVRGTIALSDTLSTLCEALGPLSLESVNSFARAMNPSLVANNPNVPSSFFLPKVIDLFFSTPDNNFLLFPLMECLASISVAVGADIFPYAYNIVARCLHFIADVMQAHSIVENIALQQLDSSYLNNVSDPPSKDFAVCSLDVIGCVAVAIRELFRSNILGFSENDQNNPQNNQYHQIRSEFLQILFQCMMDKDTDVKQSAFSLVGDIVSQGQCVMLFLTVPPPAFAALLPSTHPENINLTSDTSIGNNSLTSMLQFCLLNIGALSCTSTPKIASNAMWAIGETCMAAGSEITQRFVGGILLHVAHVLMQLSSSSTQTLTESMLGQDDDAYRGVDVTLILKENTVITLGRLCMLCPLECINVQNGMILSSEFLRFWFR